MNSGKNLYRIKLINYNIAYIMKDLHICIGNILKANNNNNDNVYDTIMNWVQINSTLNEDQLLLLDNKHVLVIYDGSFI